MLSFELEPKGSPNPKRLVIFAHSPVLGRIRIVSFEVKNLRGGIDALRDVFPDMPLDILPPKGRKRKP